MLKCDALKQLPKANMEERSLVAAVEAGGTRCTVTLASTRGVEAVGVAGACNL